MNLRDLGIRYEFDHGRLWRNPARTCGRLDIVLDQLAHIQPALPKQADGEEPLINLARQAFIILEGYIFDMEFDDSDVPLARYWQHHIPSDIAGCWQLFNLLLRQEDWLLLFEAYDATRPPSGVLENEPVEKKEPSSKNGQSDGRKSKRETKPVSG